MKLSPELKQQIVEEYNGFKYKQYAGKTLEERRKLDAFFTPPEITIKMIEQFESIENKNILDPTCGTGNLLAACVIAGVNPKMVYGNDFEPSFVSLCQERLGRLGVPKSNIHQGDARNPDCLTLDSFKKEDYNPHVNERKQLW